MESIIVAESVSSAIFYIIILKNNISLYVDILSFRELISFKQDN